MTNDPRKRLRYFNSQFLEADDFIDEQAYHIDRQRRHNRTLHTPGIAEGLEVTAATGATQATVATGTAVDELGRQIILTSEELQRTVELNNFLDQKVLLVISYVFPEPESKSETDRQTVGEKQSTRLIEQGLIQVLPVDNNNNPITVDGNTFPSGLYIRLALLTLDGSGIGGVDNSVRTNAGVRLGGETVLSKVTFSRKGVDSTQYPFLSSGAANQLDLQGDFVISGTVKNLTADGGVISGKLNVEANSPGTTGRPGSIFIHNSARGNSCGVVAKITTTPTSAPNPRSAAVAGVSSVADVHGVYATARTDTHALYVDGKARITGELITNHLVDVFINASGQRLRTGDVVKLKGTPIPRFRGLNNTAPVAEVTLADQENDIRVIGIVNGEAIPDSDTPDARVHPEDPTFIEDGGELFLVTLGAFAHCKVDATEAPIEVGDLLTSSNNPGHAKKATNPKLGSIIGKALEPLNQGTGYIAVFVNIQ